MEIQEYVQRLLAHSGISDADIEVTDNEEEVLISINAEESDVGMIIGYHGESLASLQRVIRIVFKDKITKRIVLDVNGYRQQRIEKLQEMAAQVAERVLDSGKPYVFSYLPANERFIVHTALAENSAFQNLESVSEGEGFERRLIIRKKN